MDFFLIWETKEEFILGQRKIEGELTLLSDRLKLKQGFMKVEEIRLSF